MNETQPGKIKKPQFVSGGMENYCDQNIMIKVVNPGDKILVMISDNWRTSERILVWVEASPLSWSHGIPSRMGCLALSTYDIYRHLLTY